MIKISAVFTSEDFADFALGNLKKNMNVEDVHIMAYGTTDNELPINYPVKPEFLEQSNTQYMSGMPHVLSDVALFNDFIDSEQKHEATLSFFVGEAWQRKAKNILLHYGGFNIRADPK